MAATQSSRVKALINRSKRGKPMRLAEVLAVCPYRTLFGPVGYILTEDTVPTAVVAALGFVPEDFSERMRADICATIAAGGVVGLVSNSAELRDYAKREIALALMPTGKPDA